MDRCYKKDCNCLNWHRKRWVVQVKKVDVYEYELYSWQMEHDSYGAASASVDAMLHMNPEWRKNFKIKARVRKVTTYYDRDNGRPVNRSPLWRRIKKAYQQESIKPTQNLS